jgi:predicted hotdog family 3-hydroxylacyl-ACP dehydratase
MFLIEDVLRWDAGKILCAAVSHRSPSNPLRSHGQLHVVFGSEYAAQAMALHWGLLSGKPCSQGYLAALYQSRFFADRLDTARGPLLVEAECLVNEGTGGVYKFRICAEGKPLLDGRIAVVIEMNIPAVDDHANVD